MPDFYDQYGVFHEGGICMSAISQYVLTVICTVILCAVMQMFLPGGSAGTLLKMISGLMVTITVLTPFVERQGVAIGSISGGYFV